MGIPLAIALIDNEESIRRALQRLLQSSGYLPGASGSLEVVKLGLAFCRTARGTVGQQGRPTLA